MLLQNINTFGYDHPVDIKLTRDKISGISSGSEAGKNELVITFDHAIAFPGLINSHDHLEFNLFPILANKTYNSYLEWGADIFQNNKDIIDAITKIPKQLRAEWGVFKNIFNGVTTVVHHGGHFDITNPLINVFQDCYSLHSVKLEKNWKLKLNRLFPLRQPFVIHVGEGTNSSASNEVNELIKWNLYNRELIAVHGIAMTTEQAKSFRALVWCPDSNYVLYNATANINEIKKETKILFGTDSCVSAGWNIWNHIRLARRTGMLSDEELVESLTSSPASVWNLDGKGVLSEGKDADIVIAKLPAGQYPPDGFFQLNPVDILMVICRGDIILFDERINPSVKHHLSLEDFSRLYINGIGKYVKGKLDRLVMEIKKKVPGIKFPVEFDY